MTLFRGLPRGTETEFEGKDRRCVNDGTHLHPQCKGFLPSKGVRESFGTVSWWFSTSELGDRNFDPSETLTEMIISLLLHYDTLEPPLQFFYYVEDGSTEPCTWDHCVDDKPLPPVRVPLRLLLSSFQGPEVVTHLGVYWWSWYWNFRLGGWESGWLILMVHLVPVRKGLLETSLTSKYSLSLLTVIKVGNKTYQTIRRHLLVSWSMCGGGTSKGTNILGSTSIHWVETGGVAGIERLGGQYSKIKVCGLERCEREDGPFN